MIAQFSRLPRHFCVVLYSQACRLWLLANISSLYARYIHDSLRQRNGKIEESREIRDTTLLSAVWTG